MNNKNNTAAKNITPARKCEGCGRDEFVKSWVSGPPRCMSCDLLCDDAIARGESCDDVAPGYTATIGIGSDSYAATVTAVKRDANGEIKSVTVFQETNNERSMTFTRRVRGNFVQKGDAKGTYYVTLGKRETHLDPCF